MADVQQAMTQRQRLSLARGHTTTAVHEFCFERGAESDSQPKNIGFSLAYSGSALVMIGEITAGRARF